ncbi:MAG: Gingipain R2 precursor [candidate division BRC1 bacterium ADurb.BinA292]|nr:MAG: Gingipain R2 precursor [candidate division BRC1 bacterium ADurb.BinA292]
MPLSLPAVRRSACQFIALAVVPWVIVAGQAVAAGSPPRQALRIDCQQRGLYRLTGADMQAAGIELSRVDPRRLALVHNQRAVPIHVRTARADAFGPEDDLFFFSEGGNLDTVPFVNLGEQYAPRTQIFMLHLDGNGHEPLRFEPVELEPPAAGAEPAAVRVVSGRHHYEDNDVWEFFDVNPGVETDFIYWKKLTIPATDRTTNTLVNPVLFPNTVPGAPVRIHGLLVGVSDGEHNVRISVDGKPYHEARWSGPADHAFAFELPADALAAQRGMIRFEALPQSDGPASTTSLIEYEEETNTFRHLNIDVVMVDWFEVEFRQPTAAVNDYNELLVLDETDRANIARARVTGFSSPDILAFDLGAGQVLRGGAYRHEGTPFYAIDVERPTTDTTLVVSTVERARRPQAVRPRPVKGLFAQAPAAELLILTHPDFLEAAQRLAVWKRERGLTTEVVDILDVFTEASGGYALPEALRRYIQHVYQSQTPPRLRYVLLIGDASGISKYTTWCPAYGFIESGKPINENYFATFGEPTDQPVLAVGRLSVRTAGEADQIVNKIMDYESQRHRGIWRARQLMIAANPNWASHMSQYLIRKWVRPEYFARAIQTSMDNPSPDYPDLMSNRLVEGFNAGAIIAAYMGHGGGTIWEMGPTALQSQFTNHLFDQTNVYRLENRERLPLLFALTCYTNNFNHPHVPQTLGEVFMIADGGAIAVLGASGRSDTSENLVFLDCFNRTIQTHAFRRLGEYLLATHRRIPHRQTATRYLLLGDPSLEFNVPRREIELTGQSGADARELVLDYRLPEAVPLPARLEWLLISEDEDVVAEWSTEADAAEGAVTWRVAEAASAPETWHRVIVYAPAFGADADYVGAWFIAPTQDELNRLQLRADQTTTVTLEAP